jgi:rare lipoprotein A
MTQHSTHRGDWPLAAKRFFARLTIATAGLLGLVALVSGPVAAKAPGKTHCFNGVCHYVKTIGETQRSIGKTVTVQASNYDDAKRDRYNPTNLTSSGAYFEAWKPDNAASPIYPDGTKLLVWHPGNKKTLVVRVNNAGPYYGNRTLDLSRAAADKLGFRGVATLQVKVIAAPSKSEATYKKGRTYDWVPGYVGQYASIDQAYLKNRVASADVPATTKVAAAPAAKPAPAKVAVVASKSRRS